MRRIDKAKLASLPPELRAKVEEKLALGEQIRKQNPLQGFWPHSDPQRQFFEARTPVIAAFAGNRFGKTSSLVVRSLIECLPREALPKRLQEYKRYDAPTHGWILSPTEEKVYDSLHPAIKKWVPADQLRGGNWDKAWNGQRLQLTFHCGSTISFKTYKQDASTLGGAALHFVGYDEPPPKIHRSECKMRLVDFKGFEMFAMTPIRTNTGWIRRDLWRQRDAPNVTIIKASIYDNPLLDRGAIDEALSGHPDYERRARAYGDFMDLGGLIYPDFDRCVLTEADPLVVKRGDELLIDPEFVRSIDDHIVGIDPGVRNAGFTFSAFDNENVKWAWADGKLQDSTPRDYAEFIRATLSRWGISERNVSFVCDPAMRQRNQTNAQTVMAALALEEVYCNPGQNDQQAGIGQMRTRMQHGRYKVGPNCRYLRDEADDYAGEEPEEGKDDSHLIPIKGNDHCLDADRYAAMERMWDPRMEEEAPRRQLGWDLTQSIPQHLIRTPTDTHPMGFQF